MLNTTHNNDDNILHNSISNLICKIHNSPIGGVCSDVNCTALPFIMCIKCVVESKCCIRKFSHKLISLKEYFDKIFLKKNVDKYNEIISLYKKINQYDLEEIKEVIQNYSNRESILYSDITELLRNKLNFLLMKDIYKIEKIEMENFKELNCIKEKIEIIQNDFQFYFDQTLSSENNFNFNKHCAELYYMYQNNHKTTKEVFESVNNYLSNLKSLLNKSNDVQVLNGLEKVRFLMNLSNQPVVELESVLEKKSKVITDDICRELNYYFTEKEKDINVLNDRRSIINKEIKKIPVPKSKKDNKMLADKLNIFKTKKNKKNYEKKILTDSKIKPESIIKTESKVNWLSKINLNPKGSILNKPVPEDNNQINNFSNKIEISNNSYINAFYKNANETLSEDNNQILNISNIIDISNNPFLNAFHKKANEKLQTNTPLTLLHEYKKKAKETFHKKNPFELLNESLKNKLKANETLQTNAPLVSLQEYFNNNKIDKISCYTQSNTLTPKDFFMSLDTINDDQVIIIEKFSVIVFSNFKGLFIYDYIQKKYIFTYIIKQGEKFYQKKYIVNNLKDLIYTVSSFKEIIEINLTDYKSDNGNMGNECYLKKYRIEEDSLILSPVFEMYIQEEPLFDSENFAPITFFYLASKSTLELWSLSNDKLQFLHSKDVSAADSDSHKLEYFENNFDQEVDLDKMNKSISVDKYLISTVKKYLIHLKGEITIYEAKPELINYFKINRMELNDNCNSFCLENLKSTNEAYLYSVWNSGQICIHSLKSKSIIKTISSFYNSISIQSLFSLCYLNENALLVGGKGAIYIITHGNVSLIKPATMKWKEITGRVIGLKIVMNKHEENIVSISDDGSIYMWNESKN